MNDRVICNHTASLVSGQSFETTLELADYRADAPFTRRKRKLNKEHLD
jgi:hypothetical protein